MLNSTKIKFLGLVGTFAIISTAYVLHAKTYYKELYPPLSEDKSEVNLQEPIIEQPKIKIVIVKVEKIAEPKQEIKHIENLTLQAIEQNESIPIATIKPNIISLSPSAKLNQMLKEYKYLYVEKSGEVSQNSKEILEKMIPLLTDINNSYIEIEGHSSSEEYSNLTKKISEQSAQVIYRYLISKNIGKEIVITGYGDLYPIVDDKKDKRNSRIELKIRRR